MFSRQGAEKDKKSAPRRENNPLIILIRNSHSYFFAKKSLTSPVRTAVL